MTFRVPDVKGYQPIEDPISTLSAYDSPLQTGIPLSVVLEEFKSHSQSSGDQSLVSISTDPGRYLCNFIYYKALLHQETRATPLNSLFIHVPSFDVISKDQQVEIIQRIITTICTICFQ